MNRSLAPVALVLTTLLINACGGGSSSTSTNNATPQSSQSGQFIDGPVKGASYRRGTLPQLFTTSTDGSFTFIAGERVEFRLGTISFGSIETTANTKFVTPRMLARGNDSARINMARFLITLDNDQNPNNGIEISAAVKQAAWQYSGSNDFATLDSNGLAEFARVANGSARRSLVSSDVAEKHLAQSEADISDGQYDYDSGKDTDGDGINNSLDQCPNTPSDAVVNANGCVDQTNENKDSDNDGIINGEDNCPDTANADQLDLDSDQRGDACDNDIDGDGLPNDDDSEPRNADIDSDGVKDGADNCPNSANSNQTDTDADGQGDSCDSDIDNDGIDNGDDLFPSDPTENSDNDQDGIGNNADDDDDNDGTPDNQDAFPFDPSENTDSDGDGTGNNADTDDDNDGTPDSEDAFPLDASEDTDADGDGIGNNADNDDDNDGTPDSEDAFPEDDSESSDADSDGAGDNSDQCANTSANDGQVIRGCSESQRPTISAANINISENDATVQVQVSISSAQDFDIAFGFHTIDGSALSGKDYSANNGSAVIEAGSTIASVAINVIDDDEIEGTETFELRVDSSDFAVVGESVEATITIYDNDTTPSTLRVGASKQRVNPNASQISGETEQRLGAAPRTQKFNLGGFGLNPLQNFSDPFNMAGDQLTQAAEQPCLLQDQTSYDPASFTEDQCLESTWIRALVIEQPDPENIANNQEVVFLVLDAIGAGNVIQNNVRAAVVAATGIPSSNIVFGQTHSHAGADLQGLWGGVPQSWLKNVLYPQAVAAVIEARSRKQDVELTVRSGALPEFNNYRRPRQTDPNIDSDVVGTLMQAISLSSGEPVAHFMQFNGHPTSINESPRIPHPDYPLGVTDYLETLGGVALYFNGPIADASSSGRREGCVNDPKYDDVSADYGNQHCKGEGIAEGGLGFPIERRISHGLSIRNQEVTLPVTNPLFIGVGLLGAFNQYYDFTGANGQLPEEARAQAQYLPQATPYTTTNVTRITLGDAETGLEIVTIPGEATGTFGKWIRSLANPNAHTMLLGLTQNSFGYIIPEEEFSALDASGGGGLAGVPFTGYEEFVSLGPLTAPLLRTQGYIPLFDLQEDAQAYLPTYLAACQADPASSECLFSMVGFRVDYVQREYADRCHEFGGDQAAMFCELVNPNKPLAGCYADARAENCALSPLVGLLSAPKKEICLNGGLSSAECPLSALVNPLEDNDPTGTMSALAGIAADVSSCLVNADLPLCQFAASECEQDPTGAACGVVGVLDVVHNLSDTLGLPLSGTEPGQSYCDQPAGDPDPATDAQAWQQRDFMNVLCSLQRLTDMALHPAFSVALAEGTARTFSYNLIEQLADPTRPRGTLAQWTPAGRTTDPYRIEQDWEDAGRGRVDYISFVAESGARLVGRVFRPPVNVPGPYPSIVITTGSIQGYQEMYNWAGEGLAEAGYLVLMYDVQGQGRSETLPHSPDGNYACDSDGCDGVPFQQAYNFFQGARDAHRWLLSSANNLYIEDTGNSAGSNLFNPFAADVDRSRIGHAGHSLGASAISVVGQELACDPATPRAQRDGCISAIVGWDSLSSVSDTNTLPIKAPGLSLTAEYFFNPSPASPGSPPNPDTKLDAYKQMVEANVDSMRVGLRSSTHLEWTYVPLILPASRYGERVSMYYTQAWFDRYVRDELSAVDRLKAQQFDDSADLSSIGAGTFDPLTGANIPYKIAGDCAANRLSIYQRSAFRLTDPRDNTVLNAEDMRGRGCQVDNDEDGVPDSEDAFPTDPSESKDSDGDRIGDNLDNDDDNDGVNDADDAFPFDPNESYDSDRDGVGDNSDACPNTPTDSEVDEQGCASQTNDQAGLAVCTPDGSRCISTIQELGAPLQAAADQIYAGIISAGAPLPANGEVILHAAQAAVQGCDMLDPSHCLFPFPSDQFTVLAEADTPQSTDKGGTGRRLNFNALAMPRNVAGKPIDPTEWNRNDGFSPGQMILTYVPDIATVKDQSGKATGPIEGAVPITRLADYTASDAPIVVINTATGERHPVWAEIDLNAGIFIPADTSIPSPPSKGETRPALIIRPAQNFEENTRYIVALRKLKNNSGETIAAGPAFRVCRDGDFTQLPQLTQRCEQLERNVFDFLPQDIKRDELYLAWDFTVASERSLAGRLLHIRDDAFATLGETVNILPGQAGYEIGTAPTVSVGTRTENPNARIARRIEGTITVPSYIIPSDPSPLEGGGFNDLFNQLRDNYPEALAEIRSQCRSFAPLSEMCLPFDPDAPEFGRAVSAPPNRFFYNPTDAPDSPSVFGDGLPDRAGPQATMTRKYICNIPNSAFTTPARPSLYGHGLLGSRGEVNSGHVADMADAHNMMFCAVDWFGFSEGDIASIVAILLDVSNLPSLTDSSQQGMLNMMFLARAMKHPEGFAALSDFQDDAGQALFTTDEVYYDGNSQGGIMGGAVVAVSRDVNRGVLGVPGMNYSTLLRRSVDFDIYSIPLNLAYHDDLDRSLVFSLMEMLWERAENNGYAHHMGTASSANTPYPNTPDNELLLQVGFSDHQVTMWSADVMARTIHAGVDRQDLAFPNRHPDEQEYALLEDLTIANGAQYTNDRYLGSALAIFDASWDAAPDGRCAADSTLPAPIGNIPPRDPESMPDGQRNDDPHECARREPSAKCQKSHFLYSLSTVLDVNGITRDDLCPPLPAIQ